MDKPLVSVIIPFYACDEFLLEAVDSVEAQTYENWELIIVDDCSPGRSAEEILAGHSNSEHLAGDKSHRRYPQIIRHEKNLGASAARNTAISKARGEFIVPLDADDVLEPNYIELTLAAVANTEYGGAYTDIKVFGKRFFVLPVDGTAAGIIDGRGGQTTSLYKREVFDSIGGYDESIRSGQDKDFWLSALSKGWKFVHVAEPLLNYREREGSLSDGWEERSTDLMLKLFEKHKTLFVESIDEWFPSRQRAHSDQYLYSKSLERKLVEYESRVSPVSKDSVAFKDPLASKDSSVSKHPLISIVIPFYKCDEFLFETIASVEAQSYQNFEIIIVDDCSPDLTVAEIMSGHDLSRIKIIRNEKNLGPSASRNAAVKLARGELILPLDADDLLDPSYLEKTVAALRYTDFGGASTDIECFGLQNFVYEAQCTINGIICAQGGSVTFLYKREVFDSIGGYDEELRIAEDKDFWLGAFAKGWKFVHVPEPLLKYRRHKNSLSDGIESQVGDFMIYLFNKHRQLFIDKIDTWYPLKEQQFWQTFSSYGKLSAQWEIDSRNYLALESEFKRLSQEHSAIHAEHNALERKLAAGGRAKRVLRSLLSWMGSGARS